MIRELIDSELEVVAGGRGHERVERVRVKEINQGNTVTIGSASNAGGDDNSTVTINGSVNGGSNTITF